MELLTHKTVAKLLDIPYSTWCWYRAKHVLPDGEIKYGRYNAYTHNQLPALREVLRKIGYTKGQCGRKKGR